MIHGIFGYAKELMSRSMEAGIVFPLPSITAWTVGDEVEMGVAIKMLEKSLSNGRNGRNYLRFNTASQLLAVASDIYSSRADSRSSRYSLKYHSGSVLHMYEGAVNYSLM